MFERSLAFVILVAALFGVSHWLGAAQDESPSDAEPASPGKAPESPARKEPQPPPREADEEDDEREPDPPVKERGKKKGLLPILNG